MEKFLCPICGKPVAADDAACAACGTPLDWKPTEEDTPASASPTSCRESSDGPEMPTEEDTAASASPTLAADDTSQIALTAAEPRESSEQEPAPILAPEAPAESKPSAILEDIPLPAASEDRLPPAEPEAALSAEQTLDLMPDEQERSEPARSGRAAASTRADKPAAQAKRGILRRTVVTAGLGLIGAAMVGSGVIWLKRPVIAALKNDALLIYRGHTEIVTAIAWAPDGTRLASASYDSTVQVWDVATGRHALVYRGHITPQGDMPIIWGVAWSPNGKQVASASADATVRVWDASTGKTLFTYSGHSGSVHAVAWSPDGKRLASASSDGTVQVWDASTGKGLFTYRGHARGVLAVGWSPDGTRIASSSNDYTVQVWDAADGKHPLTYKGHASLGADSYRGVYSLAWSPDGKRLASGGSDKTTQVWDASTGKTLLIYRGTADDVRAVAWAPNGTRLASAGNPSGEVQVWNATSGKTLATCSGHALIVDALAWSPDSTRLASGSFDRTARIWQPDEEQQ